MERFNPAFTTSMGHLRDAKYIEAVRASGFTFRSMDVGVVMDLMIHDIDLVLSLVRSSIRRVDAIGFSVIGGHEDLANARLEFENGAVASLSASRVSYDPIRRMSVWTDRACSSIDFASRQTSVIRPSQTLLERQFDTDALSVEEIDHYREHLLEEHLPCETLHSEPIDAFGCGAERFRGEPSVATSTSGDRRTWCSGRRSGRADPRGDRITLLGRYERRAGRPPCSPPPKHHSGAATGT